MSETAESSSSTPSTTVLGDWGVMVRSDEVKRSVWVSPRGTTRLRIHASAFESKEAAEAWIEQLMADPRNAHLIAKAAPLRSTS